MNKITVYDVTLREGMQSPETAFTLADKVRMARLLDKMGVDIIEGGSPVSNPKDGEFFKVCEDMPFRNKICAFGPTCRADKTPGEDKAMWILAECPADYICIFGKASLFHVREILRTTPENNLRIIGDSIRFLTSKGKKVIFDCEHYFDGYKEDPEYAAECIKEAVKAGAVNITLCDTNGGTLPGDLCRTVKETIELFPGVDFGIHCHNDSGCADANTAEGVRCGIKTVQVSLHGYGERCGNANLFTVIPDICLKMSCETGCDLPEFSDLAVKSADILNIKVPYKAPYVGKDAFSHKAGTHIDGVLKNPSSFEHTDPANVGAHRRFSVSEVSGKAAVYAKMKQLMPDLNVDEETAARVCEALKEKELEGYQFENADASFEMMVRRLTGLYKPFFRLNNYKVVDFSGERDVEWTASAIVDVMVGEEAEITADKGIGPVDALDRALRKALERFYPEIGTMHLNDYKVRVLDTKQATASMVRVLIESTDGYRVWNTVGVSGDIIEASWIALCDAHEYLLQMIADRKK